MSNNKPKTPSKGNSGIGMDGYQPKPKPSGINTNGYQPPKSSGTSPTTPPPKKP